jgi:hypothetical protein
MSSFATAFTTDRETLRPAQKPVRTDAFVRPPRAYRGLSKCAKERTEGYVDSNMNSNVEERRFSAA